MAIFGTAGHIDHGKTALVHTLTGIDADRLPEEKKRGMTIDLGFAWLESLSGEKIGIIDVPGHENFIRNMIIGMTSVDAFILVVDAKEGWKPQTEEHFQIIQLLDISFGMIVITKTDLVSQDRLKQVEQDVQEKISLLRNYKISVISFSIKDNQAICRIREQIDKINSITPQKKDIGKPRLFIDRVFDIKGSGTVVTGTLINGNLYQNQYLNIFPLNKKVRLRQLQSYGSQVEAAKIGSRVALNLAGVKKEELHRGDLLYGNQKYHYGKLIDVNIILPSQKTAYILKNGTELDFICHTKVLKGRIVFRKKELKSGEQSFAQIRFPESLCLMTGDYFVIRLPGINETIGGGKILDSLAAKHSFTKPQWIDWLEKRKNIDLPQLILTDLQKYSVVKKDELLVNNPFSAEEIKQTLDKLNSQKLLFLTGDWVIDNKFWRTQISQTMDNLKKMHQNYPFKESFPLIKLKNMLPRMSDELFNVLLDYLIQAQQIKIKNGEVSSFKHKVFLSNHQKEIVKNILDYIEKDPKHLPTAKELNSQFSAKSELIQLLIKNGEIISLEEQILITPKVYREMKNKIIDHLKKSGSITIGQVRDLLSISRKYIVPLLTKMDEEGITLRRENKRVLKKQ